VDKTVVIGPVEHIFVTGVKHLRMFLVIFSRIEFYDVFYFFTIELRPGVTQYMTEVTSLDFF